MLGLLGLRQLSLWSEFRPLLTDPKNRAWLHARLGTTPSDAALVPAGYKSRGIAFVLSGCAAAFAGLMSIAVVGSRGQDAHAAGLGVLSLALAIWYLLVTVYPERAARVARRTFPSTGPAAILVYPLVLALCGMMLIFRVLPVPPHAK